MRKSTALSQTQVNTFVVIKDRISPNTCQEQLIQTPLMVPEHAELKLQRKNLLSNWKCEMLLTHIFLYPTLFGKYQKSPVSQQQKLSSVLYPPIYAVIKTFFHLYLMTKLTVLSQCFTTIHTPKCKRWHKPRLWLYADCMPIRLHDHALQGTNKCPFVVQLEN